MTRTRNAAAVCLALVLGQASLGQQPGGGNPGPGTPPGNGGQPGNGQNGPIVVAPGGGGGDGGRSQTDPIARYLMVKDAYKSVNFDITAPKLDARAQIDADLYLKYALAAFDRFDAHRKRVVNEQDFLVKSYKDADRTNRREQDELAKDQGLAAKRNVFSRYLEGMNALATPKAVVATGRPLNGYLERVNQAGSFGSLMAVAASDAFKLHRPEAVRVSSGVGERAVRMPIVGSNQPFHPPAFLSLDGRLRPKLDAYEQSRKAAASAPGPAKADAAAAAQDGLTDLDAAVQGMMKGMKVTAFHDERYQESLAWKKFFAEERRLLNWMGAGSSREAFDGKTVVDLLLYMRRNGYTFAAADPGDEDAYAALHQQLRDLCVKASEEPASGSETRLAEFIKQTDRLRERLPPPAPTAEGEAPKLGGK